MDQSPQTRQYYFRIYPVNPARGFFRQKHTIGVGGPIFKAGKWYTLNLTLEQKTYMANTKQNQLDSLSQPVFQIVNTKEECEDIIRSEKRAALQNKGVSMDQFEDDILEEKVEEQTPSFSDLRDQAKVVDETKVSLSQKKAATVPNIEPVPKPTVQTAAQKAVASALKSKMDNPQKKSKNEIGKK